MIYTFFTLGIFESLFLALILIFKKNKSISDNILAFSFIIISINIFFSFLECFNQEHQFKYSFLINISSPLVMLHGPFLWLYTKSQTTPRFRLKLKYLLQLISFFIIFIYHYFAFYRHSANEKIIMAKTESFVHTYIYQFLLVCMIIVIFSYLIICIKLITKYGKTLEKYFSNKSNIDMKWLKLVIVGAMITYIVVYILIISNEFYHFTTFKTSEAIGYCLASILIFTWGFFGIRQTQVFSSFNFIINDNTVVVHEEKDETLNHLLNIMSVQKLYLDPDLTIAKLSEISNLTITQVSFLLNSKLNKTFFDFVNSYRIEEFKKQLRIKENKKLTILGIAFNCGFNSKATFNRVFKTYLHITPKEYKLSLEESETSFLKN